jgi:multidrug efflux pump subunit AcrA (membrane-fusion protein)
VTRFSDLVQLSTRTMTAEVDLKNPDLDLVPGMYAQVQLDVARSPHAVAVPVAAVDGTGAAARVFTVDDTGLVHVHAVKTGIQTPQFIEVVSGIEPGETVVVGARSGLEDGQKVQPHFEQ